MKKNELENEKKKGKGKGLFLLVLVLVACVFVTLAFSFFTNGAKLTFPGLFATLKSGTLYAVLGAVLAGGLLYLLITWRTNAKKDVLSQNDGAHNHFLSDYEISHSEYFVRCTAKDLPNLADGLPVRAIINGNKTEIVYAKKPIHAYDLGTTGSGKTTGFVDPSIQILARFKTKPCLIITDPKGELYRKHSDFLRKQGYTVSRIDYRYPYQSTKTNPFQPIIDRVVKIRNAYSAKKGSYYDSNGNKYTDYVAGKAATEAMCQTLKDEIYENTTDLVMTLFQVDSTSDPSWEKNSRAFIRGLILCLIDDCLAGLLPLEKLCFANIFYILATFCSESKFPLLVEYVTAHDDNLKAVVDFSTVADSLASEKTFASYISTIKGYVSQIADDGILCMTSGNELSFDAFDQSANAVFLIFPDEKVSRHPFVSLFLVQTYKALVDRAIRNKEEGRTQAEELLRNTYFIMDEFGNLPKLHGFHNTVTVARSRKVFFICVLQSFAQLDSRYGEKDAKTIKSQLNICIYTGTNDKASVEEFSWIVGRKKVATVSASVAVGKETNDSFAVKEIPLITTEDLLNLCKDNSGRTVVACFGQLPILSEFTPAYKAPKFYITGNTDESLRAAEIFNAKPLQYDITEYKPPKKQHEEELEDEQLSNLADELDGMTDLTEEELEQMQQQALLDEENRKAALAIETAKIAVEKKLAFIRQYIPEKDYAVLCDPNATDKIAVIHKLIADDDGSMPLAVRHELSFLIVEIKRLWNLIGGNQYENIK